MKTLVVNNYRDASKVGLVRVAVEYFSEPEVVWYADIQAGFRVGDAVSAVVLTGSEARVVEERDVALYRNVIDLVKRVRVPVLGICFGHQLACLAFGAEVGALKKPVKNRFERVHVVKPNGLFEGFAPGETILVAEFHNDYVKRESLARAGFELLAYSASCETEAVRYGNSPLFGIQFHAERTRVGEEEHLEGLRVIENFFKLCR